MRHEHVKNAIKLPLLLIIAVTLGLVAEIWWDGDLVHGNWPSVVGGLLIFSGTILLAWAQQVRHPILAKDEPEPGLLLRGAYRLTRYPTQVAMFFLAFGLAVLINSPSVFVAVLVVLIATKIILLPREDAFMQKRFGEHYEQYRKGTKSKK